MAIEVVNRIDIGLLTVRHKQRIPSDFLYKGGRVFRAAKDFYGLSVLLGGRILSAYYQIPIETYSAELQAAGDIANPKYARDEVYATWPGRRYHCWNCNVLGAYVFNDDYPIFALLRQAPNGDIQFLKIPQRPVPCFSRSEIDIIEALDDILFSEDYAGHRCRDFKDLLASYDGEVVSASTLSEFDWIRREKIEGRPKDEQGHFADVLPHYIYYIDVAW